LVVPTLAQIVTLYVCLENDKIKVLIHVCF
jgi:hypothetical protein